MQVNTQYNICEQHMVKLFLYKYFTKLFFYKIKYSSHKGNPLQLRTWALVETLGFCKSIRNCSIFFKWKLSIFPILSTFV